MVFAEPPVDVLYREEFPVNPGSRVFSVEYLPGQFDQRADSAVQCVQFLNEDEKPVIRSATTYVIEGKISDQELEALHGRIGPLVKLARQILHLSLIHISRKAPCQITPGLYCSRLSVRFCR